VLLLCPIASAEVLKVEGGGFVVQHRAVLAATPQRAWDRLVQVQAWWDPQHTYSGASRNLSLTLSPGGCFCERLAAGGFVKHAEVVQARTRELLRLSGALGPLQDLGAGGALTFALAPAEAGTEVTLTYRVSGSLPDVEKLAAIVDQVLGEQLRRYASPPAPH
jgi:hypothetical protein